VRRGLFILIRRFLYVIERDELQKSHAIFCFPTSEFHVNSIALSRFRLSALSVSAILHMAAPPQNLSSLDYLNGRSAFSVIALRSVRATREIVKPTRLQAALRKDTGLRITAGQHQPLVVPTEVLRERTITAFKEERLGDLELFWKAAMRWDSFRHEAERLAAAATSS
jgi:hypothetical protein